MTDKVCVITGVGPGTGTALARSLGPKGVHVAYVVIARDDRSPTAIGP